VVAVGKVDRFAIGRKNECVRAVLARTHLDFADVIKAVELVVAVRIANPPDAGARSTLVDHDIETVERVQQAMRTDRDAFEHSLFLLWIAFRITGRRRFVFDDLGEIDIEFFDLRPGRGADCRYRQSV
jgi:hypothetical protein